MNPLRALKKAPPPKGKPGISPLKFLRTGKVLEPVRDIRTPIRTRKEELQRAAQAAAARITFQVPGEKGQAGGDYRAPHREGAPLKEYLMALGLMPLLGKFAMYDMTNLSKGRLRLYYVPGPGAVLRFYPPSASPVAHLQRSNVDAMKLAFNMGGGAKEVVYTLRQPQPEEE